MVDFEGGLKRGVPLQYVLIKVCVLGVHVKFFFHLMSNFNGLKVLALFERFAVGGRALNAFLKKRKKRGGGKIAFVVQHLSALSTVISQVLYMYVLQYIIVQMPGYKAH